MKWKGEVALGVGVGIFRGYVGDNYHHKHWAHQISIGLDGPLVIEGAKGRQCVEVAVIRAGTPHKLLHGQMISIYVDPSSDIFRLLFRSSLPAESIASIAKQDLASFLNLPHHCRSLYDLLAEIQGMTRNQHIDSSERLSLVLAKLHESIEFDFKASSDDLAEVAGLSPSRFSHWFRECTGMPLRGYKKWLKLRTAIEHVLSGKSFIYAALESGFSDQAHFSRSFSQAFGLTLRDAIKALDTDHTSP